MKIKEDIKAYSKNTIEQIKVILISASFHTLILYRLSSFLTNNIPVVGTYFGLMLEYLNRVLYSVDISRYATIGGGFMIVHGMGIVIGSEVKIGKNCKILNGVNLGNKNTEIPYNEQPIIGDNVVIGAGAKCLGKIRIGDNVVIGSNAVVLCDVPDDSLAVGIPATIKKKN